MIYLKQFESFSQKPVKKFPTQQAIHWNYLLQVLKESGIDPHKELYKRQDGTYFQDFCFEKCSSRKDVVFPNMVDKEEWSKEGQNDPRYTNFIFGESIFLLPISYDPSNDATEAIQKKKSFFDEMKEFARKMGKTKSEEEKFLKNLEDNVRFGPSGYDWANPALKVIHDKLGQYYKDGKLRIWFPKDRDYDPWEGYDYPHKYNIVGDLDRPNGVYYLSDIEKYIEYRYGISDDLFYKFIIDNNYIEGRYWERVWSLSVTDIDKTKLQKTKFGKYGMEPTENINHILNIIEKDFSNEISGTDYEGFPIYIDYYKKVLDKYS